MKIQQAAADFLASTRIAVTGVSRTPAGHGGNVVYARLKERGYEAIPVNPHAELIDGDRAYPDLRSIPGGVEAVVIATRPEHALQTAREAAELGITKLWMHRSFGSGSVSQDAADYARQQGMTVIAGGCPLMFGPASDGGHRLMCRWFTLTGKVPRQV